MVSIRRRARRLMIGLEARTLSGTRRGRLATAFVTLVPSFGAALVPSFALVRVLTTDIVTSQSSWSSIPYPTSSPGNGLTAASRFVCRRRCLRGADHVGRRAGRASARGPAGRASGPAARLPVAAEVTAHVPEVLPDVSGDAAVIPATSAVIPTPSAVIPVAPAAVEEILHRAAGEAEPRSQSRAEE